MSFVSKFCELRNGEAVVEDQIPILPIEEFRSEIVQAVKSGKRLCALFTDGETGDSRGLFSVLADDHAGKLFLIASRLASRYPALTTDIAQAHLFEREIYESSGIIPENHPWLKLVRATPADGVTFFREEGAEIHELAVGPIHAGIIEPGHFRFQCRGEIIHHLEIQLGYQRRGVERLLRGTPNRRALSVAESVCGDTSIGHALSYCVVLEALSSTAVDLRAEALRAAALEMERLANHIGDLGAISGDVGFLPAAAYFGRLRGNFLNMLMSFSGNRYGRGLMRPGGVNFDLDPKLRAEFLATIQQAKKDLKNVGDLFFGDSSVIARLEETGIVSRQICADLGVVGLAARASGLDRDARRDHPRGFFRFRHIPVVTLEGGDVYARAMARRLEAERSLDFLSGILPDLPEGDILSPRANERPNLVAVALVEGWRGEICHVARTDGEGRISWYKIVDPSFHNWIAVALAMRGGEVSDFPLCNKSFNLSCAGHDL